MAVDEGAVEQVALPETMLGVVHKEVVRCAAAEALVAAAGVQTQQMVAKRFHVRRPKPANFDVQRLSITHGIPPVRPRRLIPGGILCTAL